MEIAIMRNTRHNSSTKEHWSSPGDAILADNSRERFAVYRGDKAFSALPSAYDDFGGPTRSTT